MIALEEARRILIASITPVESETVSHAEALGRTLAAPLTARLTQPPFDASAMDGYAVRSEDLTGAEARLTLAGEAAAGARFSGSLAAGTAVRVSTGAPIPDGTGQIVIRENAVLSGDMIATSDPPLPGRHIRRAGVDFTAGDTLLPAGTRIGPDAVALIAGCGQVDVVVRRLPRVGVLATGNELVEPGRDPGPDQIINSVSKGVMAFITAAGGAPVDLGIARDDPASVRASLARLEGCDLAVTIGGASVGDHDHLRSVFAAMGGKLAFEKIAIRPGKPGWFGTLKSTPVLGLPGNPVSAMVVARLLLAPAMDGLLGRPVAAALPLRPVVLAEALDANGPREAFLRARIDQGKAALFDNQDSSVLSVLARADCLIRRAANAPAARAGEAVEALDLA